jgi:hypothetical protein
MPYWGLKFRIMQELIIKVLKAFRTSNYKLFFIVQAVIWSAYAVITSGEYFEFKYIEQVTFALAAVTSALTTLKDKELDEEPENK